MRTMAVLSALFVGSLAATPALASEKTLVPEFEYLADGWLEPLTIEMGQFWSLFGLQENGINYYSSGAPLEGSPYWERMNPLSPLYQAWFGTYVVNDFQFADEWYPTPHCAEDIPNSIQRVAELTVIDQTVWLLGYEDPAPLAQIVPGSLQVTKEGNFFHMVYVMESHSDVGGTIPAYPWYPPYAALEDLVDPYHPVTIEGNIFFQYKKSTQQLIVKYSSTATYTLKDGTVLQTPAWVEDDQQAMLDDIEYHRVSVE